MGAMCSFYLAVVDLQEGGEREQGEPSNDRYRDDVGFDRVAIRAQFGPGVFATSFIAGYANTDLHNSVLLLEMSKILHPRLYDVARGSAEDIGPSFALPV